MEPEHEMRDALRTSNALANELLGRLLAHTRILQAVLEFLPDARTVIRSISPTTFEDTLMADAIADPTISAAVNELQRIQALTRP
jgi:hypothetical protein